MVDSATRIQNYDGNHVNHLDPVKIKRLFGDALEKDMEKFSSQEALDNQRAYPKDEMKYFINAVCKAAVERHLIFPLPEIILSHLVVTKLTDQQVRFIAAESHKITQQRGYL